MKLYIKDVNNCWECPCYFELPFMNKKECHHKSRGKGKSELDDGGRFCECCPLVDKVEYIDYDY